MKKAPKAPDPIQTAQAQSQANREAVAESARVNAVDITGPDGTVRYRRNADGTPAEQIISLTPLQQQARDQQNQLATILGGQALNQSSNLPQDRFSLAQFGPRPSETDFGAQSQQVRDAVYGQAMGMLNPTFETENRTLEQQIANRGLPVAGEAAQLLRDQAGRRQGDARQQALFQAIQAGGSEQNRLFNLQNTARQQGISEYQMERQQPFNELSAYLQGQPVFNQQAPQMAQYQVAPADVAGNIYRNYDAQNQRYMANLNGLYSAFGAAAGAAGNYFGGR